MPPKRTSRQSAPARQQTRSFLARDNEDDWGHGEDHDDGGGDSAAANDAGSGDLREMEESLKRSMAFDTGVRKEQKQLRLESEFERQVSELEGRIDQKVVACREKVNRIQDQQLTKLLTLAQRKAEVEAQIIKHTQELADAYTAIREEFEAVLKGRSEDVEEASAALDKLDKEATQGQEQ